MNILFLDMDGVLNSNYLINKWFDNKTKEISIIKPNIDELELKQTVLYIFRKEFNHSQELIFPELADRLEDIIIQCNLNIIWSSSWRKLKIYENINNAREMFNRRGLCGNALIDYTISYNRIRNSSENRVSEILYSVYEHKYNIKRDKIAAIDDMNLFALEKNGIKFFRTDEEFGLTDHVKNEMIKFYSKK